MTELAKAFFSVYSKATPVGKKTEAFKYKYADLESVDKMLRPLMIEAGLFPRFSVIVDDQAVEWLELHISHAESGEGTEFRMPLLHADDMQGLGSALTYARRYLLLSAFHLITVGEDDDGAKATERGRARHETHSAITKAEADALEDLAMARMEELFPDRDESFYRKEGRRAIQAVKKEKGISGKLKREDIGSVRDRLSSFTFESHEGGEEF